MLPLVVVLGQNIAGAFYSLLSRRLAVTLPHAQMQVTAVLFALTFGFAAPIALVYGDVHLNALVVWWPLLLCAGIATSISVALFLSAFRYLDAAMGTLLATMHVVLSVLGGMYLLGEHMGIQQLTGAALVVVAVTYALSVHVSKRERRNWLRGILFAIGSAIAFAVGAVIEKYLLGQMNIPSYVVWGLGSQCLVGLSFGVLLGRRHFRDVLRLRHATLLIGTGIIRTCMAMFFVFSLVLLKSLCIAIVLAGLRPLFVAFLAAWLLRERKFLLRKVIASIVAALGIAVMFW